MNEKSLLKITGRIQLISLMKSIKNTFVADTPSELNTIIPLFVIKRDRAISIILLTIYCYMLKGERVLGDSEKKKITKE